MSVGCDSGSFGSSTFGSDFSGGDTGLEDELLSDLRRVPPKIKTPNPAITPERMRRFFTASSQINSPGMCSFDRGWVSVGGGIDGGGGGDGGGIVVGGIVVSMVKPSSGIRVMGGSGVGSNPRGGRSLLAGAKALPHSPL